MKTVFIDYETYYNKEYSLRKMTPVEYVLDHRFECIGCAVKEGLDAEPYWVDGVDLPLFFAELNPKDTMLVSHNALFDACITAWRYNFHPRLTADTLSIARATIGHETKSLSLANVALKLGIGVKGGTVHKVEGMGAEAIHAAGLYDEYIQYALNDVELCAAIYRTLVVEKRLFPIRELAVMDMVIRCAIEPQMQLDQNVLALHLHNIKTRKQELLAQVGIDKSDLMSNDKFAQALRNLGVEPPTKMSFLTGKESYAFAKTDPAFMELLDHDEPQVQVLASARLGLKSTLEETRTERFTSIARLTWPGKKQGLMPMPLRYSGAHTHRLCLVGETTIAVLRDNRVVCIRLDVLRDTDLVWDGEVFVRHGGLSYAGIKQVIEYDGVVGTPDHRVWTVELGYCPLETAKERGYRIARGSVPDAERIDASVQWAGIIPYENQVHLREVPSNDGLAMGGFISTSKGLVQVLPQEGADGRGSTIQSNAGRCQKSEQESYRSASVGLGIGAGTSIGEAHSKSAGESSLRQMARAGLEGCHAGSGQGASEVHQSGGVQLSLLRGPGDRVPVRVNSVHGGLAADKSGSPTAGVVSGPDRLQRALRAGKPSLGQQTDASSEPLFKPTWDIIGCGPRNRFMANGRIVHNSGDWSLNVQNMPRGGELRRALIAPPGYVVLAADSSQIEARIVAWISGQLDLIEQFARGEDVYSSFASKVFGREINKKTDPAERFIGKTAILGLGYGLGWNKFQRTVKMQSKAQTGKLIDLSDEEAIKIVQTYRNAYSSIPALWRILNENINVISSGNGSFAIGPCEFKHKNITLPNGLRLNYHDLKFDNSEWTYTYAGKPKRLYGGSLLENIVQALARIVVMDAASRLQVKLAMYDVQLALQVHDELVYVVPEEVAKVCEQITLEEMSVRPSWAPTLPLAAEASYGRSYGDAK